MLGGLLVLLQGEFFDGVCFLPLPDEHVVHHCAAAEDYSQAYKDAGYDRGSRVELDKGVEYYS